MLLKQIIGMLILALNVMGVGFLLCMIGIVLKNKLYPNKQIFVVKKRGGKKKKSAINNDNIFDDEDDLLKNIDLSDLDNLNLDDFD